jgi:hypothetical protein
VNYKKVWEKGIKEGGDGHVFGLDDILAQMLDMRRPET